MTAVSTGDPIHQDSGTAGTWSRVNIAEAAPGIQTPLSWAIWRTGIELGMRGGYHDLGLIKASEVRIPSDVEDRIVAIFYGRPAVNVDVLMALLSTFTSGAGDNINALMFGASDPRSEAPAPSPSGSATILGGVARARTFAKLVVTASLLSRRVSRERAQVLSWWRSATRTRDWGPDEARSVFVDAHERFGRVMRLHGAAGALMQPLYDWIGRAAADAGHPGAEMVVLSGQGIDETQELQHLWAVAHGGTSLETFVSEFGFHGPAEGELASRSWREDPAPLLGLIEQLRDRGPEHSPAAHLDQQQRNRAVALSELLAATSLPRRLGVRVVVPIARRFLQLRERGKFAFLLAFDSARCSARALGAELAASGVLNDPEDVFYLTGDEIASTGLPENIRALVSQRRADRTAYEALELPDQWVGRAEPVPATESASTQVTRLDAIGASPGVAQGLARVVIDPASAEIEEGEILVCSLTDPSWAALTMMSAAVVIDIGGPLSHGAVVARELAVPCVINTRTAVRVINTGDLIRVDGGAGSVEIIRRSGDVEPMSTR